jgi:hypothetical protein
MAGTETSNSEQPDTEADRVRSGAVPFPTTAQVSGRDRAVLRAVAAGRCRLRAGCEPVLVVDGVACADSGVARRLIVAGLLVPPVGPADRARLTAAGRAALGLVQA